MSNESLDSNLLKYALWHQETEKLSNEELCRKVLTVAPLVGELGELIDILVERLCPGIIDKIADEPIQKLNDKA
jgi:hypothetical protein